MSSAAAVEAMTVGQIHIEVPEIYLTILYENVMVDYRQQYLIPIDYRYTAGRYRKEVRGYGRSMLSVLMYGNIMGATAAETGTLGTLYAWSGYRWEVIPWPWLYALRD